ncbi:MAG: hypothetical protein WBV94_15460 [Blastocatellia bacterium]
MYYDKVIIIFEKDGEQTIRGEVMIKGEVLARVDPELTADYLLQNFWTMHKAAQEN